MVQHGAGRQHDERGPQLLSTAGRNLIFFFYFFFCVFSAWPRCFLRERVCACVTVRVCFWRVTSTRVPSHPQVPGTEMKREVWGCGRVSSGGGGGLPKGPFQGCLVAVRIL